MDREASEPALPRMVGIVAASGGLQAMMTILSELPSDFPLPILFFQAMSSPHSVRLGRSRWHV
jgi:chemotaxis response regulator CheB